jgi:hypothetical protein
MVALTPELEERLGLVKRKTPPNPYEEEPLPSFSRKQVGPNPRFEIPVNSRQNLGRIAGILRALASEYDRLKDDPTLNDADALYDAAYAARLVAKEMRRLETKVGKKKAWNAD